MALRPHKEKIQDTHLVVSARDPAEEDEVCDEETDAQMEVDAGPGSLDGAAELERQDTEKQTDQRQR